MDLTDLFNEKVLAFLGAISAVLIAKVFVDSRETRKAQERVLEAEKEAFTNAPQAMLAKVARIVETDSERAEFGAGVTPAVMAEAEIRLGAGLLFDLYNKQIEKYQTETQSRASWSFAFAILAMFAGLGFVIWGGTVVFSASGWQHAASGTAISAIGGTSAAYITKTFLDVHRLSLLQLNTYFRQPVLNSHVLTAQRVANLIDDAEAKKAAYVSIVERITSLISEDVTPEPRARARDGRAKTSNGEAAAARRRREVDAETSGA